MMDRKIRPAVEISIDLDRDRVAEIVWESWGNTHDDPLPNGNTLITYGMHARLVEVNEASEEIWNLRRIRMEGERNVKNRIYRSERIPDLFPLAFTLNGPADSTHVPAGESYMQFTINNIGSHAQAYIYEVTDSEHWFEDTDTTDLLDAKASAVIIIYGQAPEAVSYDTVYIKIYPLIKSDLVDSWTAILQSDPEYFVEDNSNLPDNQYLMINYPNPFNNSTTIQFLLTANANTSLIIYNQSGRRIDILLNENLSEGFYSVCWRPEGMASGSYYYILSTPEGSESRIMSHIR